MSFLRLILVPKHISKRYKLKLPPDEAIKAISEIIDLSNDSSLPFLFDSHDKSYNGGVNELAFFAKPKEERSRIDLVYHTEINGKVEPHFNDSIVNINSRLSEKAKDYCLYFTFTAIICFSIAFVFDNTTTTLSYSAGFSIVAIQLFYRFKLRLGLYLFVAQFRESLKSNAIELVQSPR